MLGSWEIILILFFIMVLFGPSKMSELITYLQKGTKEFKSALTNLDDSNTKV
mgnify:FL=1